VDVIDGYFTVQLGLDGVEFNSDGVHWLEVAVRDANSTDPCDYVTLSPRQQLTPTPYAVYAENASVDSDWMVSANNMYSIPSGRVGIGTTNPSSKLHIEDDSTLDVKVTINNLNDAGSERLSFGTDAGMTAWGAANSSNPSKWRFFNNRTSGNYDWVTSGSIRMALSNSGNLGIGTTTPESRLHIRSSHPEIRFEESDQSDKKWAIAGYNSGLLFNEIGAGNAIFIDEGGRVGIGTTSPEQKLEVSGYAVASRFYDRESTSYYLDPGNTVESAKFAGNVGIGTTAPSSKLHVQGSSTGEVSLKINNTNNTGSERIYFGSTTSEAAMIVYGPSNASNPGKWRFVNNNTSGHYDWIAGGSIRMTLANNGNLGIGTTDPAQKLTVRGGNILIESSDGTDILELGEGLDYAEGFDVSESTKIDAGTVLIIDSDNPGKLAISVKAYDSEVAGIVAGAKGIGSGVRLGAGGFDYDVALAGRVYCNVDATEEGIEPGDLLTTSATPGHAMKSTDYARAQGAILGKAMESLEKGQKGQILVLVTLQ
jgi:hypothetical protein